MPERKQSTGKISVFEGKQAALNLAIFEELYKNPLIIYDITKRIKEQNPFCRLKPSIVGRRVRNLVDQGYLEKIGSRNTKPGPSRKLFQLTMKAKVALHYQLISREKFLNEADEETLNAELATLKLFLKKVGKSKSSPL